MAILDFHDCCINVTQCLNLLLDLPKADINMKVVYVSQMSFYQKKNTISRYLYINVHRLR